MNGPLWIRLDEPRWQVWARRHPKAAESMGFAVVWLLGMIAGWVLAWMTN